MADSAYTAARKIAEADLKTTNPIRLGLALNYSVFCYEVNILFYIFIFYIIYFINLGS